MKTKLAALLILMLCPVILTAAKAKTYRAESPYGSVVLSVEVGVRLTWSFSHENQPIIEPSAISLSLESGEILGSNPKVISVKNEKINTSFNAVNYRRSVVTDVCSQLTLTFKGNYGVIFRVYDDAVAYRFFTRRPGEIIIKNEEAEFNFTGDMDAFIPIQWDYRDGKIFNSSFEALYREIPLSRFPKDSLAFLPVLVDAGKGKKAEIFEADLEDYPGMYVNLNHVNGYGLKGVFAPYPVETYVKGLNIIPSKRADYIARTSGTRNFPWRALFISEQDKDLLNCDLVQKLASPNRLSDISWIKTGQVAWDWWNSMNISHVPFRAGMNTPSYKYFIDFASEYKVPYILLDAGWNIPGDLTRPKSDINLDELVSYGREKGVSLILWCSWKDVIAQKEKAFPFFSRTGIKGLKIDFIDRDDQLAVASTYEIAKLAADNKLMVDYHGVFKPAGLQRTYPNVVGFEGVKGGENFKWANEDQPRYCVTIPYIRNLAGPMDYTSGSMRNASQANFRPINDMPMSKGTRVNQMAQYIVFDVPVQMLSDNPTIYMREHECTDFITRVPTTFDETFPLDGQVAEYIALAKRKGDTWFVAAMTNWKPRELTIDFSFLGEGNYHAEIFSDGINADRDATDYIKETADIRKGEKLKVKLMNGGGWAARIEKIN